jgi:nucleoside 2-deoxyribosyltransferase
MKILVVGGLRDDFQDGSSEEVCARALGKAIASSGHILLNGCYNRFDRFVAEAAAQVAETQGLSAATVVHTYVSPGCKPSHRLGQLLTLNVPSWDPGQPDWGIPEPLRECEAVVVMGGGPATHRVVHLSRLAGKAILPVAAFGGAAKEAFRTEWSRFDAFYGGRVSKDDFAALNTALEALDQQGAFDGLASNLVSMLARIVLGNEVFVVMSFRDESDDSYNTIARVCRGYGLEPNRTDRAPTTERIYSRIVQGIQRAAFVIADVTFSSVNVYYELGFAEALGKDVLVVAKEGTALPFDTNDIPTLFFKDQTRLEDALRARIGRLTGRQLRATN